VTFFSGIDFNSEIYEIDCLVITLVKAKIENIIAIAK